MKEELIACQDPQITVGTDIKLNYICSCWGQEHLEAESFIEKVIANEFDGIEINLPETGVFSDCFINEIESIFASNPDFIFIARQLTNPDNKKAGTYIKSKKWFAGYWQDIICYKTEQGWKDFTITPEHGPFPYMPQIPFTQ